MFHEEKLISGVLHWRNTPDGKWIARTPEQLSQRVIELERQIAWKDEVIFEAQQGEDL